jgi:glycosyltransferase involved in cell wall biosynthesis
MYNEAAGAARCVREVCSILTGLPERTGLIVVEDGSDDCTKQILQQLAESEPKLEVVVHARNMGYGTALRTGVEHAVQTGYDYALFMDSDLTNDPRDIPRFVAKMKGGVDVIKASRYIRGGGMLGVPLHRVLISRLGNSIARLLFGIGVRDCTNGFRAVRLDILARMHLQENGFAVIVEELYQSKFLASTYAEVPTTLTNRRTEIRSTSFTYKPSIFLKYLKYGIKARLSIRPKKERT